MTNYQRTSETIFALIDGEVKFENFARGRKRVSVYPVAMMAASEEAAAAD